ncbi:uncharacterized protein LOC135925404 isoform X2 [Gordionus sp. m RMFG-2023]|uniref:uncharacterized protein LOC135925404 isoform X2 n=1 Tax=Gordionus sp. m RMFG-2023 TaxID=3053472 RepID=UPI0031FC4082
MQGYSDLCHLNDDDTSPLTLLVRACSNLDPKLPQNDKKRPLDPENIIFTKSNLSHSELMTPRKIIKQDDIKTNRLMRSRQSEHDFTRNEGNSAFMKNNSRFPVNSIHVCNNDKTRDAFVPKEMPHYKNDDKDSSTPYKRESILSVDFTKIFSPPVFPCPFSSSAKTIVNSTLYDFISAKSSYQISGRSENHFNPFKLFTSLKSPIVGNNYVYPSTAKKGSSLDNGKTSKLICSYRKKEQNNEKRGSSCCKCGCSNSFISPHYQHFNASPHSFYNNPYLNYPYFYKMFCQSLNYPQDFSFNLNRYPHPLWCSPDECSPLDNNGGTNPKLTQHSEGFTMNSKSPEHISHPQNKDSTFDEDVKSYFSLNLFPISSITSNTKQSSSVIDNDNNTNKNSNIPEARTNLVTSRNATEYHTSMNFQERNILTTDIFNTTYGSLMNSSNNISHQTIPLLGTRQYSLMSNLYNSPNLGYNSPSLSSPVDPYYFMNLFEYYFYNQFYNQMIYPPSSEINLMHNSNNFYPLSNSALTDKDFIHNL